MILALSNARKFAAECIQEAQNKYKRHYNRTSRTATFQLGEWILIQFPQEESGANRKLSQPWHGPYRVINSSDTGVTAVKVYFPDESCVQVHQSRVSRCLILPHLDMITHPLFTHSVSYGACFGRCGSRFHGAHISHITGTARNHQSSMDGFRPLFYSGRTHQLAPLIMCPATYW